MRISVDPADSGYVDLMRAGLRYDCLLDGDLVRGAITADEEEGLVVAHKFDENGKHVLNATRTAIETVERRGVVRLVKREA